MDSNRSIQTIRLNSIGLYSIRGGSWAALLDQPQPSYLNKEPLGVCRKTEMKKADGARNETFPTNSYLTLLPSLPFPPWKKFPHVILQVLVGRPQEAIER